MWAKALKFLTNLAFKRIFMGFLTPRKKREPNQWRVCAVCSHEFRAFNGRQRVCKKLNCRRIDRARQYQAMLVQKKLEVKASFFDHEEQE
ncbi:hypothetical protein LCGC14_3140250 [marine sediment metagenome]|uniref:Uncharacterized protein n=1 Tax=marine sediment metagenome TaxID=412755 RepID=A0A0F8VX19_9ZZZZ